MLPEGVGLALEAGECQDPGMTEPGMAEEVAMLEDRRLAVLRAIVEDYVRTRYGTRYGTRYEGRKKIMIRPAQS